MQGVEKTAKTVEEAIELALQELFLTQDQVEVEVLEENQGGFLGIGKSATVRVTPLEIETQEEPTVSYVEEETSFASVESDEADEDLKADEDQELADDAENLSEEERLALARYTVEDFLRSILVSFHLDEVNNLNVSVEDGRIMAKIEGEDCGILIGRKGATLRSLQYLTSLAANKVTKSRVRLTLDIGSYKEKRNSSVVDLAIRTAKRAVETGQAFELSPMSASERRVVHESLQGFEGITTYSEGEEPNRYVVIDLAYEDKNFPDDEI